MEENIYKLPAITDFSEIRKSLEDILRRLNNQNRAHLSHITARLYITIAGHSHDDQTIEKARKEAEYFLDKAKEYNEAPSPCSFND